MVLEEISYHRKDGTAIKVADVFTIGANGNKQAKNRSRVRNEYENERGILRVVSAQRRGGKQPVDLAEYAVVSKIGHKPAFEWWVPFMLRKRDRVISKLLKKYWLTTNKFGLEIPHSVKRAYDIDDETGTELWRKAITREILKVKVEYEDNEATPEEIRSGKAAGFIGFQEITCHLIFNVKMKFSRKCSW